MQTRIMAELERFAELSREKDLLNERWDEQHTLLVESHERVVQEITEEYEARIQVRAPGQILHDCFQSDSLKRLPAGARVCDPHVSPTSMQNHHGLG